MLAKSKKIKKGNRYKDIVFSVLIGIFLVFIAGFLIISNLNINQKRGEMADKIEGLNREIELLEQRNEELMSGIGQLETSFRQQEILREQGFAPLGEETIVILPPGSGQSSPTEEEKKNIFEKIWEIIGF